MGWRFENGLLVKRKHIGLLSLSTEMSPKKYTAKSHVIVSYLAAAINDRQHTTERTTTRPRCPTPKPGSLKVPKDGSLLNNPVKTG